jgi:hypothetical protein
LLPNQVFTHRLERESKSSKISGGREVMMLLERFLQRGNKGKNHACTPRFVLGLTNSATHISSSQARPSNTPEGRDVILL